MPTERKKKQKVVALKYDVLKQSAPQIVAKGLGNMAERIVEVAGEHGIPLKEDPELVEILSQLEVGKDIPAELYQAVAEVMIMNASASCSISCRSKQYYILQEYVFTYIITFTNL